jgi:signal transduction histidine kinase
MRFPALVLVVSLTLTAITTWATSVSSASRDRSRFDGFVRLTEDRIRGRLDAYTAMLLGARGLFAAQGKVTAHQFYSYVHQLQIERRFPGMQGIGFSKRVAPDEREQLSQFMKPQGFPDFKIWPEHERSEYHAIIYLDPLDARNRAAIGYDMFSEPTRRQAMEQARDTGEPAASGKVTLVQEIDDDKQVGFLLYVPVYQQGQLPRTVEERQRMLEGFVYSPFRLDDLFNSLFGGIVEPQVAFDLYDGARVTPERLLFSSSSVKMPAHQALRMMMVGGRSWTLVFSSLPALEASSLTPLVPLVALIGIATSLALFVAAGAEARARHAAELSRAEAELHVHQLSAKEREARAAVQLRDDFLSVASHELKTPLTSLRLQLDLAFQSIKAIPQPTLHNRLAVISRQLSRLSGLVESLLDVARISTGRLALHPEPTDLSALAHDIAERLRPELLRNGSTLSVSSEKPVHGNWDALRLEQVMVNLLSNAGKYGGGKPVVLSVFREDDWAVFRVRDEGIGIAPEDAARIFERFERAVPSQQYGGLGLGLYIVHEVLKAMGGSISVESTPGEGTAFTVRLPLESASSAHGSAPSPVASIAE